MDARLAKWPSAGFSTSRPTIRDVDKDYCEEALIRQLQNNDYVNGPSGIGSRTHGTLLGLIIN